MAPEMINGLSYDYTIDIWALGILLYELLHGFSPFTGNTREVIYSNINNNNIQFNKNLSTQVINLINIILNHNPV